MKTSINEIIKGAKKYLPHIEEERILKAYEFAKKAHKGQLRASGEPYIQHPLGVAVLLIEIGMDTDTIAAGLLHDVIEDTDIDLESLEQTFGSQIANLVDGFADWAAFEKIKNSGQRSRRGYRLPDLHGNYHTGKRNLAHENPCAFAKSCPEVIGR